MENNKQNTGAGGKAFSGNPNPNPNSSFNSVPAADAGSAPEIALRTAIRSTFTNLSQLDADLVLARALQQQERALMMFRMGGIDGSGYVSSYGGSYDEEEEEPVRVHELVDDEEGSVEESDYGEDAFNAIGSEINAVDFENDEAFARAIQHVEDREIAFWLLAHAGLNDWGMVEHRDHGNYDQDAWQHGLSYEELVALGEIVGTESRGLSVDTIASLPSFSYKAEDGKEYNSDQCVICRLDYADGDTLVTLSCKHNYHTKCINVWLQFSKVCPVCSAEVSVSGSGHRQIV